MYDGSDKYGHNRYAKRGLKLLTNFSKDQLPKYHNAAKEFHSLNLTIDKEAFDINGGSAKGCCALLCGINDNQDRAKFWNRISKISKI